MQECQKNNLIHRLTQKSIENNADLARNILIEAMNAPKKYNKLPIYMKDTNRKVKSVNGIAEGFKNFSQYQEETWKEN